MQTLQTALRMLSKTLDARTSAFDLACWRLGDLLYTRSVQTEDGTAVAVYAADGTLLFVAESEAHVVRTAEDNDMELAILH